MLLFCDLGLLNTEDMAEVSGTLTIPNLSDEQDIPDIEVSSAHILLHSLILAIIITENAIQLAEVTFSLDFLCVKSGLPE